MSLQYLLRAARILAFAGVAGSLLTAKGHWTELNIGPFTVDSQGNEAEARDALVQAEQLRWVTGTLLEKPDVRAVWPIRIVFVPEGTPGPKPLAAPASTNGETVLVCTIGTPLPLEVIARLFLQANTPRLPDDVETGLLQLLSTVEAKGSHVSWGGPTGKPGLPFARMQLFATKFEYSASFHVLVASLKSGSSLRVAERNAFGKDPATLEREAQANLQVGSWQAVPISGRPLDPKRDFGEHTAEGPLVEAALAATLIDSDPARAESLFKAAIEAGGRAKPVGFAGLAALATHNKEDARPFLQSALSAGSMAPTVYVALAQGEPAAIAIPLLKKAALGNPAWAVPVYQQSQLATEPLEKETLLKKAVEIDPRATAYWVELAKLQATDGHAIEAQGSWLRAEASAPAAEREGIRGMRDRAEQARLDAAEAERTHERDAVRAEDRRAQDSETARIHAAEAKANGSLETSANGAGTPEAPVVPWDATLPQKRVTGTIVEVECLRGGTRLTVRDRGGKTVAVLAETSAKLGLSCGAQQPARRVSLSYAIDPDVKSRTAGRVTDFHLP